MFDAENVLRGKESVTVINSHVTTVSLGTARSHLHLKTSIYINETIIEFFVMDPILSDLEILC